MLTTSEIINLLKDDLTSMAIERLHKAENKTHYFTMDNRDTLDKNSFIAYTGENFNPLKFLKNSDPQDLPFVFYEQNEENDQIVLDYNNCFNFIPVVNSLCFLQHVAKQISLKFQAQGGVAIGVSGSNGKTTTKDMLHHLFEGCLPGKVVSTKKNNNNHIGVPLTIFDLKVDSQILICELGSNHPGEMKIILDILQPNVGLTTNIGQTHLEFFHSLDNVFKEESLIYHYIKKKKGKKIFIRNNLDAFTKQLTKESFVYDLGDEADFCLDLQQKQLDFGKIRLSLENESLIGSFNTLNLAMASSVMIKVSEEFSLNVEMNQIHKLIQSYRPQNMRTEFKQINGTEILLDAYNANPSSMIESLKSYAEYLEQKKISHQQVLLVVGDMNELGSYCQTGHEEVANYITAHFSGAKVVFIGRFEEYFHPEVADLKKYASVESFEDQFFQQTKNSSHVFLKASRSVKLENLLLNEDKIGNVSTID